MILDSLIAPLSVFSLRTGKTLRLCKPLHKLNMAEPSDILGRVRRVNNDSLFGLVICHEVGIVVSRALPYSLSIQTITLPSGCSYTWGSIGCAWCAMLLASDVSFPKH
jgi:hypothetical protein